MPITYTDVEFKCEDACLALLNTPAAFALAEATTGHANTSKTLPIVVCGCQQGEQDMEATGNYWCTVEIAIRSSAPEDVGNVDTIQPDRDLCATVFSVFQIDDLADQLSASRADFTCLQVKEFKHVNGQDGDAWTNALHFQALCCGSNL